RIINLAPNVFKQRLHAGKTRGQNKRAALGGVEDSDNFIGGGGGPFTIARVGHSGRQVENRLALIVETRRGNEIVGRIEAESIANETEVAATRECGRSQNYSQHFLKRLILQQS